MSQYQKNAAKLLENYTTSANEEAEMQKKLIDEQTDQLIANAEKEVTEKTEQVDQSYRDVVDTVAVQRELDRRQIAETMANMGLTKSGLSATQQTAVQLSAGNKTAAARLQRQAAVDALKKSLAEYKLTQENERTTQKSAVDATTQANIAAYGSDVYKAANEADAALVKAASDAAKSNKETLTSLYKNGAIDAATYAVALEQGWSPSVALAKQETAATAPTDNAWSWGTTAYRKTGKDTNNWGKFLGFIGDAGIDRDDTVEFIGQDGRERTISLKELDERLEKEGMTEIDRKQFVERFNRNDGDGKNIEYYINPHITDYLNTIILQKRDNGKDGEKIKKFKEKWIRTISDMSESGEISDNEMHALFKAAEINEVDIQAATAEKLKNQA